MSAYLLLASDWQEITGWVAIVNFLATATTLLSILSLKKDSTSAVAWCMSVLFIPGLGIALYWLFGYQSIHRPLQRKRRHAELYQKRRTSEFNAPIANPQPEGAWAGVARLGASVGASPLTAGNRVQLFFEGRSAFDAMLEVIRSAKLHIHMEFFIFREDATGDEFIQALVERARAGVQVRFLYDAVGSWKLHRKYLLRLTEAGGKFSPFLSLNLLRRRIQINLRNHRKILVVDGQVAFTGGFNIADEYVGKNPFFGPWRDTMLRLEGPGVRWLQRVFIEDWSFASREELSAHEFSPVLPTVGDEAAQIAWSGPDQEVKTIREIYLAAIAHAKDRIWIASPYFVPDATLLDLLCLAARGGCDVRLLVPFRPDKWLPFLAARYYWRDALAAGVKVYQYTHGFMHAKTMIVDAVWASVGSANFDNRSLHLNFEVTCLIESKKVVAELEAAFLRDLNVSIRVAPEQFEQRGLVGRLMENACRLLSPVL